MLRSKFKYMTKGFGTESSLKNKLEEKYSHRLPKGRLISWSPWPPANFKTRYPAFPFVLTILILFIGQTYISNLR